MELVILSFGKNRKTKNFPGTLSSNDRLTIKIVLKLNLIRLKCHVHETNKPEGNHSKVYGEGIGTE